MTTENSSPIEKFDLTEDDLKRFWREAGREIVNKSIDTLDEVAKQLLAVAGILEGLYFHAITYTDLQGSVSGWALVIYLTPVILLLFSIIFGLIVFLPETYRINIANWRIGKSTFEKICQRKLIAVRFASVFLGLAILSLVVAISQFLLG